MSYRYIDIHTHLNLDAFDVDGSEVALRTQSEGVAYVNVGTGRGTSARAHALARSSVSGVFATVGIHPTHVSDGDEVFDYTYYKSLAEDEKVVAIGECGFDFYRVSKDTKKLQEEGFVKQIELANELGKPLMLHIRPSTGSMDAYEDALAVLKAHAKVLGNVHFFAGTYEVAKQFWDIGFTTSFTGVITFADQYDDVIKNAPLDMLHAETDAPYVAPVPYRGKRNEPMHVREVVKHIAMLRGEDEGVVRSALIKNAERLFKIEL